MKYSEKKKFERFVLKILEKIKEDMHSYDHVSRIVQNAKIDLGEFLDEENHNE